MDAVDTIVVAVNSWPDDAVPGVEDVRELTPLALVQQRRTAGDAGSASEHSRAPFSRRCRPPPSWRRPRRSEARAPLPKPPTPSATTLPIDVESPRLRPSRFRPIENVVVTAPIDDGAGTDIAERAAHPCGEGMIRPGLRDRHGILR